MSTPLGDTTNMSLREILWAQSDVFKRAVRYSIVIGFLSLMPTVFMLQVYDRVINSRNLVTLAMLVLLVIGSYVMQELLEIVRYGLLQDVSKSLDRSIRFRLFKTSFTVSRLRGGAVNTQVFADLKMMMDFLPSHSVTAMLDAPMALVFLLILFVMSPWLCASAFVGAVVQVAIAAMTERSTMPALTKANNAAIAANGYVHSVLRNTQVIEAMGMLSSVHRLWMSKQSVFLEMQAKASDTAGMNTSASKFIQNLQGSILLGGSCLLTLYGMLLGGGGMMIVASTIGGKVLTPLVQLVASWRMVVMARDSYRRLDMTLNSEPEQTPSMPLPPPKGLLSVEGVVAGAPGSPVAILRGVSFSVSPGECVMIVGPSGSGKTTLARMVMGLWPAGSGKVRLDGADVYTWDKAQLGPYIGYLPQTVELFDGTVAENIARFGPLDKDKVNEAIALVGLTALMQELPHGIDTRVGEDGAMLSGGQRQRVALARAIYNYPKLIVLDEPNSSLDTEGERALLATLGQLKAMGCTLLLITHRTSVLPAADKLLVLRDGAVSMYGPRDEVLASLNRG